jgi:GNAT superfamily N-acetyltransferase
MTDGTQSTGWLKRIEKFRDFLIIMIRHRLPMLYSLLSTLNNLYCRVFFRYFKNNFVHREWEGVRPGDTVRVLAVQHAPQLVALIQSASEASKSFFQPHAIDKTTFSQLLQAPYYLAVGYFCATELVGYVFIRLYYPKKAFAGYFVSDLQQGKGIGKHLFKIIKAIARESGFDLYTYVKKNNLASIHISSDFVVEQNIPGGYLVLKHGNNQSL